MDWGRLHQERKFFSPRAGAQPSSQNQINYILDLARQKGQSQPRLPKTKRGASNLIERLLDLPDAVGGLAPPDVGRPVPVTNEARAELVTEVRKAFPVLTPMMVNSLVALTMAVDELGAFFFFSELPDRVGEDSPTDYAEELIPWILHEFLCWLE